jgi:ketosteroid isomerase-like protein
LVAGGERLAPTGRRLELRGGLFITLDEDGRIAEVSEYVDPGQFLIQLSPGDPSE